jgi:formate dehydrogenase subunit delta
MNAAHLIKMANEIAAFFASYPDPEQAAAETAAHLKKFWAPALRAALIAHARQDERGLAPIARRAVALLDGRGGVDPARGEGSGFRG